MLLNKYRIIKAACFCFLLSSCGFLDKGSIPSNNFDTDGFDNFRIGDSAENLIEVSDSRIDDCYFAKDNKNDDIEFQVINNKISVISSMHVGREFYNGIKVGDSEEKIYKNYDKQNLDKMENPYGDSKKDYSLIYWSDSTKKLGIRYDVESGVVVGINVGDSNLTLMEGCA